MRKVKNVTLIDGTGRIQQAKLAFPGEPPWWLELTSEMTVQKTRFNGDDLFEALCNLRKYLEPKGLRVLCNGSRVDAFPSEMSRQMGGGRRLYILKMGQPAQEDSLVDMFDMACDGKVGTVAEQEEYFKRWLAS